METLDGDGINGDAATPADETAEMTVAVYAAPDQVTAETVRGALEAEGIPAVIGEQVADAFSGAMALGEGFWGEVRVPATYEQQARDALAAFEQETALSEEELAAQAEAASDPQV